MNVFPFPFTRVPDPTESVPRSFCFVGTRLRDKCERTTDIVSVCRHSLAHRSAHVFFFVFCFLKYLFIEIILTHKFYFDFDGLRELLIELVRRRERLLAYEKYDDRAYKESRRNEMYRASIIIVQCMSESECESCLTVFNQSIIVAIVFQSVLKSVDSLRISPSSLFYGKLAVFRRERKYVPLPCGNTSM